MFLVLFLYAIIFVYYLLCLHSWPADQLTSWPADQLTSCLYRWERHAQTTAAKAGPPQCVLIARGGRCTKIFRLINHVIVHYKHQIQLWMIETCFFLCCTFSSFSHSFEGILLQSNHTENFWQMIGCNAKRWIHIKPLANLLSEYSVIWKWIFRSYLPL